MRVVLVLACAALAVASMSCFVGDALPLIRPVASPTPDFQATIAAALAQAEARRAAATADPTTDASSSGQPSAVDAAGPTATSEPQPTAVASPGMAPTPTPALTPTVTPTRMSTPAFTSTRLPQPTSDRTSVLTPTAEGPTNERRFHGPELEKEIHRLINVERVQRGIPPLGSDERINAIARDHSEDMAANDFFLHDNLNGQDPTDRGNQAGYPCRKELGGGVFSYGLGENIWRGWEYSSRIHGSGGIRYNWMTQSELASQAVSGWMNSTGHRENILDPQYDKTGIGAAFGVAEGKPYAVYMTQNFC